jgi:hypothetical protein
VERENDNDYLRAESNNSASGIYKEVAIDLAEYPVLSWRWKIEGIIDKGDATKKAGDDYAARVYVTFEYDPETTSFVERLKYKVAGLIYGKVPANAINYIWANRLPRGTHIPTLRAGPGLRANGSKKRGTSTRTTGSFSGPNRPGSWA